MRCSRIKAFHSETELFLDILHVLVVCIREHSNIDAYQLIVGASLMPIPACFINGINDMGVVVTKTEAQNNKRASDAAKAVVTVLQVLIVRDMLHLLIAVACGHKHGIRTSINLLLDDIQEL